MWFAANVKVFAPIVPGRFAATVPTEAAMSVVLSSAKSVPESVLLHPSSRRHLQKQSYVQSVAKGLATSAFP